MTRLAIDPADIDPCFAATGLTTAHSTLAVLAHPDCPLDFVLDNLGTLKALEALVNAAIVRTVTAKTLELING